VTTKEVEVSQRSIAALEQLGFSTYEARVYIGLLKQNPITGYQLSRLSSVPRSRIYETLERLTAKGYAIALQSDPVEYCPLAVPELLAHLQEHFDGALSNLDTELSKLATTPATESIWNLLGRENILQRAQSMIAKAQVSVYVVGWGETIQALKRELEAADRRGVRLVIISCGESKIEVGKHYRHAFEKELVQDCDCSINVVTDGMEVLVGQTEPPDTCQAAWSHSPALIFITEEYIRHEVYLHKIIERFGEAQAAGLRQALADGLREVPHSETHTIDVTGF
jgi:HTH-type transcriptional regulator, sugar sensing transcriptional regulator